MPFKRKTKKVEKPEVKEIIETDEPTASIEDFNTTVDNSFFYTSDKQLNAIDDAEIVKQLIQKYPDFSQ